MAARLVRLRFPAKISTVSSCLRRNFSSVSYSSLTGRCSYGVSLGNQRQFSANQNAEVKLDKTLLAKLRKETGFGFSKCREALMMNQNDYTVAETWLQEQAEKEGWQKATKLKGRSAGEGLVGVMVEHGDINLAAMVEMNCETDFVARNETFVDLASLVTSSALLYRKSIVKQNQKHNIFGNQVVHLREIILTHELNKLRIEKNNPDSILISDMVVKVIGKLGENIKLGKAISMTTDDNNVLGSYVHGAFVTEMNSCSLGKYGAVIAVKPLNPDYDSDALLTLANKLAQHVVGMNPKVITGEADASGEQSASDLTDILVQQEYLLDSSLTVGELLKKERAQVVDFVRYECGVK